MFEDNVEGLKKSVIRPTYKVKEADFNAKNSYRPIFNILFACKLIEKVVLKQFTEHIGDSCYNSPYQHGYKNGKLETKSYVKLLIGVSEVHTLIVHVSTPLEVEEKQAGNLAYDLGRIFEVSRVFVRHFDLRFFSSFHF